jgi:hypothetical protein
LPVSQPNSARRALSGGVGRASRSTSRRLGSLPIEALSSSPTLALFSQSWKALLSFTTNVRGEIFNTGAVLPTTHRPFPDELWNIRVGGNYRYLFDNG